MEHLLENKSQHNKTPILVTGGSGYLGSILIEKLCEFKQDIVALYRNKMPESRAYLYPIAADLLNKVSLETPLSGVHTVIHLAWEKSTVSDKSSGVSGETKNVIALKNLIEIMETHRVPRIVFISAVGVCREATDPFLLEKYGCEQLIINSAIKEKIIIRSSVLFGGGKELGFILAVKNLMKSAIFYPIPQAEAMVCPLHVEDLAELISKCVLVKMYEFCAVLDLVGGEPYKVGQLFKIVAQKSRKSLIPIPYIFGDIFIRFIERHKPITETRISEYLMIGSRIEKKIRHKNPLSKLLPEKCRTFQESYEVSF
jgi:nucleoside-diphosphate-sugar epimerase